MDRQTVIIVGAGACGLMAASELANRFNIIILEGRSRVGGRIHTLHSGLSSAPIESGAEFVHGDLPVTSELLKQAGTHPVKAEGKFYRKEHRQWKEQTEMIEGWDELLRTMKGLKEDMTMAEFLDLHYPDDEYIDFRRQVTAYTEGFDIADVTKASVQALYKEWSHEEDVFRLPQGYSTLIDFLYNECTRKHCQILTDQTVKQIDWEKDHVTIYTSDKQKYYAQKVIITVPVSVLCRTTGKSSINITPPLDAHIKAAHEIGMGDVVKVSLNFREPFWQPDTAFIFSDEIFPTWWTQLPDTTPLLTGWAGGPKAEWLSQYSEQEIMLAALQSLGNIFEIPAEEIRSNVVESYVFNWKQDDYALGAYSFSMPGSAMARKVLNTPVEDTVYFAGEAIYEGASPGTVEAGLSSGRVVARKCKMQNEEYKM